LQCIRPKFDTWRRRISGEILGGMKKRSREEWARIVAEFNGSGQRKSEFARARGLHPGTLSWWITAFKVGRVRGKRQAGEVGPLRLLDVAVRAREPVSSAGSVEVTLNGITVRFPMGADASYVGAVISEVKAAC
jgi:transposase-like protein